MRDEDILAIADELGGAMWLSVPDEEIITFARRIQTAQKEKDAGICDERYLDCMEPEMKELAAAIREQQ